MKRRDFMLTAPVTGLAGTPASSAQSAGPSPSATPYLEWLSTAVAAALEREAIGIPVSLRAYLAIASSEAMLSDLLASSAAAAVTWFGSNAWRVFAAGSPENSTATLLVEFEAGQTAILTAETFPQQPTVTLLFFGNHGTMRFDDSPATPAVTPGPRELVAAVKRSLRSGQPVKVDHAR